MDIVVRLSEAKRQLDVSEKVLQEISKCIQDSDPLDALKRAEKKWRNYNGVYRKKYNETLRNVLANMG